MADKRESHEVTEDKPAYRFGEAVEKGVDHVIDVIKERRDSMDEKDKQHEPTEDSFAYRIGETVEKAVDHVIDVVKERRESQSEGPKKEPDPSSVMT